MKKYLLMTVLAIAGTQLKAVEPLSRTFTARPHEVDAGTQFNVEHATRLIDNVVLGEDPAPLGGGPAG